MQRPGKTGSLRACAAATRARRDADIYHRYAVGLYRQALFGALLRRLATSPAAAVEDGNQVTMRRM